MSLHAVEGSFTNRFLFEIRLQISQYPEIMLLVFAFAVLALGRAEVDIITSPAGPGNQYVRLQTGHQRDISNLSDTQVQIKDDGLIGVQHKYPIKKVDLVQEKKDVVAVKATVKDEGASGLLKKQSGNGVPPLKHLPYEVLSNNKEEEGGLDFEDDFHPLNKKKLVPAGTSQASRVNVKKGPNGQDYEYEYVYYYYDEDEDEPTTTKNKDAAVHESRTRQEVVEEEPKKRNEASRNRYTTIERGRATVTTTEQNNELVPRGGQRTRGRQFESQSIPQEEERLPANTRFPSRGRNGLHTTQTPQTEIPTRSRTSSGNVRRPSLVDSSSFRTHSSDVAPDAAQEQYYTNHRNSAEVPQNTRESDLEEYIDTVRPTTFSPPSTTTIRFHPLPPVPEEEDSMPDKAAHDLYAILQQTKEENYVSPGEVEEATTEIVTTPTTTTTSTTTTEATTTTTTTTAAPGRSRFRGVNGARARPRPSSFSTTQSPEPKEVSEEPRKNKFQPQRNRATSYRRSTTQAPQEESTTQKRGFGSSNRYRSRGKQQEEEKVESTTQAATARPTRPRLNISGARPLRPGPKINLRRTSTQAPVSEEIVTQAVPQEELIETTPATSPSPPPTPQDALSRLRNRPRLRVGARPHPSETSTTTTQASEASTVSEETPSSSPEPAKPSPLLRRRPNIRRLTLPHSQPQQQQ